MEMVWFIIRIGLFLFLSLLTVDGKRRDRLCAATVKHAKHTYIVEVVDQRRRREKVDTIASSTGASIHGVEVTDVRGMNSKGVRLRL